MVLNEGKISSFSPICKKGRSAVIVSVGKSPWSIRGTLDTIIEHVYGMMLRVTAPQVEHKVSSSSRSFCDEVSLVQACHARVLVH